MTDMSTNAPVPGLRCTVYSVPYTYNPQPQPSGVTAISSSATTDAEGLAVVQVSEPGSSNHGELYGVVEDLSNGGLVVVSQLSLSTASSVPSSAVIVTDRGVYKTGDTVHVKLWVRGQEGTEMGFPNAGYELAVQWTRDEAWQIQFVQLDRTTGSFSIDLIVPEDAQYGDHSLILQERVEQSQYYSYRRTVGTTTLTVAGSQTTYCSHDLKPSNGEMVLSKTGLLICR